MRNLSPSPPPKRSGAGARAFTVLELMVAISVMTLIVLVLYRIFDQTQRAMRSNVAQTDVMENGRIAMEGLVRDLEGMQAPLVRQGTNVAISYYAAYTRPPVVQTLPPPPSPPVGKESRTNVFEGVYFLTRSNNAWYATVYRVLQSTTLMTNVNQRAFAATYLLPPADGYGALCRQVIPLTRSNLYTLSLAQLASLILATNDLDYLQSFQPTAEGVVHFRVKAFDSANRPVALATNLYEDVLRFPDLFDLDVLGNRVIPGKTNAVFLNPTLPAYLEVELGVLESLVAERLQAIPAQNRAARTRFLAQQAERVQLFRQRVPIRNAPLLLP